MGRAMHDLLAARAQMAMSLGFLWRRRYRLARVAAAGQVSPILWGWALALFPSLIYLFRVFKREPARS